MINDNTTISCLDLSHIFYGMNPEKLYKRNQEYKKTIDNLVNTLTERKKYYNDLLEQRLENKLNRQIHEKNDRLYDLDEEIIEYIKNNINSNKEFVIHPAFLRKKCIDLIKEIILQNQEKYKKLMRKENIEEYKEGENGFISEKNSSFINKLIDYIIIERNKEENIKINHELEFNNLIII